MRPRYENQKTLAAETKFKESLEARFNVEFQKLPISYRADFAVIKDGEVTGFAELKNRNVDYETYPTLILSLSKYQAMELLTPYGSPVLFVRFNDGDYMYTFDSLSTRIEVGGRWDRDECQDIEPVVHIPRSYLKQIHYDDTTE